MLNLKENIKRKLVKREIANKNTAFKGNSPTQDCATVSGISVAPYNARRILNLR